MPRDYTRIHRLLKILTLIQGQKGWTPRRLAQECGTTERTIYRDIRALEAAGVSCHFDAETGGYLPPRDFFLPPVQLQLDEALALLILAEQIGGREQLPYVRPAARAAAKVSGHLPRSLREEVERVAGRTSIQLLPAQREQPRDVYDCVCRAIASRRQLLCTYESVSRSAPSTSNSQPIDPAFQRDPHAADNGNPKRAAGDEAFHLKPYTLFFSHRAWYVLGHHSRRNAVRCLKLSRFTRCEITDRPYAIPPDFSLRKHLGLAWRMIRGQRRHKVELHFAPEFAETVADTHWHETQDVEWHDDDSLTFRCEVDGLDEIVWWVLGMGPACRVVKPKELAKRTRELAAAIVKNYADEGPARK